MKFFCYFLVIVQRIILAFSRFIYCTDKAEIGFAILKNIKGIDTCDLITDSFIEELLKPFYRPNSASKTLKILQFILENASQPGKSKVTKGLIVVIRRGDLFRIIRNGDSSTHGAICTKRKHRNRQLTAHPGIDKSHHLSLEHAIFQQRFPPIHVRGDYKEACGGASDSGHQHQDNEHRLRQNHRVLPDAKFARKLQRFRPPHSLRDHHEGRRRVGSGMSRTVSHPRHAHRQCSSAHLEPERSPFKPEEIYHELYRAAPQLATNHFVQRAFASMDCENYASIVR